MFTTVVIYMFTYGDTTYWIYAVLNKSHIIP